jgi:preprotein translocase subunit SecF
MSELKIYNFMGLRRIALVFSTVLLLVSAGSLFSQGLVLGLDFSGGTQIEVGYEKPVDVANLRNQLNQAGFDDPVVVHYGSDSDVLIRMQGQPDQGLAERLYSVLKVSDEEIDLRRVDYVGPHRRW